MDFTTQEISFFNFTELQPAETEKIVKILQYRHRDGIEFPWEDQDQDVYVAEGGTSRPNQFTQQATPNVQSDYQYVPSVAGISFGTVDLQKENLGKSHYSQDLSQLTKTNVLPPSGEPTPQSANITPNNVQCVKPDSEQPPGGTVQKERRNKKKRPPGYYESIYKQDGGNVGQANHENVNHNISPPISSLSSVTNMQLQAQQPNVVHVNQTGSAQQSSDGNYISVLKVSIQQNEGTSQAMQNDIKGRQHVVAPPVEEKQLVHNVSQPNISVNVQNNNNSKTGVKTVEQGTGDARELENRTGDQFDQNINSNESVSANTHSNITIASGNSERHENNGTISQEVSQNSVTKEPSHDASDPSASKNTTPTEGNAKQQTPPPQQAKSWAGLFKNTKSPSNASIAYVSYPESGRNVNSQNNVQQPSKEEVKHEEPVTVAASQDKNAKQLGDILLNYKASHRPSPLQPRGLINRGNWCYINATLQALLACPPFYNLLNHLPKFPALSRGPSSTPIIDSLVQLVSEFHPYQYPKGKKEKRQAEVLPGYPFEPSNVYAMLQVIKSNSSFMNGKQEDAEEFLSCVLNGLHDEMVSAICEVTGKQDEEEEVSAEKNGPDQSMNGDAVVVDGELEQSEDEDEWEQVGPKNKSIITRAAKFAHSPISEIFGGQIRSAVYQHGSRESATLEPFFTLQLDIQPETVWTVKDALSGLVSKESIHGYTCSKTKQEVEASRKLTLEELPPVLVLHLKCFIYDKNGGSQKVIKNVEYTVDLDISKELLSPSVRPKLPQGQRNYKLFAVVYHHGKHATGGHYTTDIYHNGINGWIRIDDSTVKPITVSQLTKYSPPRVPYLLYYRRCDLI